MHYALYAYEGHAEAEYVIVVMGSGAVTCSETAKYLQEKGEKAINHNAPCFCMSSFAARRRFADISYLLVCMAVLHGAS